MTAVITANEGRGAAENLVPRPVRAELTDERGPAPTGVRGDDAGVLRLAADALGLPERPDGNVVFALDEAAATGPEGYQLESGAEGVRIVAADAPGLLYGLQTLRQLTAGGPGRGVPLGTVEDRPRYAYRGGMLDVARHFFPVASVKRYVDLLTLYKFNHLHLHLTDDQGWRIAVDDWPELTGIGAAGEVGGGPGGFYTADEYRDLVAYAAERHITVVPEVDLPGHTNAAIAAYPKLGCDGDPAASMPYTATDVGFSRVDTDKEEVYEFVESVVAALAALTPGPYVHLGGDEAPKVEPADYARFMTRVAGIVRAHGKRAVAWDEAALAGAGSLDVLQVWRPSGQVDDTIREAIAAAAAAGSHLIMSPADHAYLDMKYHAGTELGLEWAGHVSTEKSYGWDPARYLPSAVEDAVIGVEAPLWTETVGTLEEAGTLLLPRLPALAEIGWTPAADRDWADFAARLAVQESLWRALGWSYTRTDDVPWQD